MCKILVFPDRSEKARLESVIKEALSYHDPETQPKKLTAIMDIVDRYLSDENPPLTIHPPEREPFTDAQIEAIKISLTAYVSARIELMRSAVLEMSCLQVKLIDMETLRGNP